jgi:hypothetical protein
MTTHFIKKVLISAAIMNFLGVLLFSKLFTNQALNEADPVVMSNFGLLMILVWGLAYLSAALITSNIAWIMGVFVLVKAIYVIRWATWLSGNNLTGVFETDIFAGLFYSIYGLNDFVFMILFICAFVSQQKLHATRIASKE